MMRFSVILSKGMIVVGGVLLLIALLSLDCFYFVVY